MADTLLVKGEADGPEYTVKYFNAATGADITGQVTTPVPGQGWVTPMLAPGAFVDMRLEVTAPAGMPDLPDLQVSVRAIGGTGRWQSDVVTARVTVRSPAVRR